jgi:ubiquinone/menaquinone biosynthesis C-methylase UbiE
MPKLPFSRRLLKVFHPEAIPALGTYFYNAISGTTMFQRNYDHVARDILAYCPDGKILDIGTGPARLLIALHRHRPQLQLVGIDASAAMVERARDNIGAAGLLGEIEVKQAKAKSLPFEDCSFDGVVSTGSIHHWKEPRACIAEIYRVLKGESYALLYDVVSDTPKDVIAASAVNFGRFRVLLLWLHSFEEPFYSQEALEELAVSTSFCDTKTRWVGVLCCLTMRKPAT